MRLRLLVCFALVAATLAVYLQVRGHDFVNYDDYVYLSHIETGFGVEGLRNAFTQHLLSNWVPLTWVVLLVDFELWGRDPAGYHLTSVALHAVGAVLLFLALARMTRATGRSAFVAAVFALHPLHVESVAWLAERKDVLSGLFFMLALHAYARFVEQPTSRGRYAVVVACLVLGLMAKPMLVTLPLVLLLLDIWPLARVGADAPAAAWRRCVVEKLPLLAIAAAVGVVTVYMQDRAGSLAGTEAFSIPSRLANAVDAYWTYVAQSLWPAGLAAFYPHRGDALSAARALALGGLLVLATLAALRLRRRTPYVAVGWLWYVVTLAPVIGLVQVGSQAHADRYMYLPQIGLTLIVAWGAVDVWERMRADPRTLAIAASGIVMALAWATWLQVGYWRDTIALHEHAVAVTRGNFRAQDGLAAALRREGRLDEAAEHYAEAARLAPGRARTWIGRAEVLFELERFDEAIEAYRAGLRLQPNHIRAHINLGHALLRTERFDEARAHFERAFELDGGRGLAASGAIPFLVSLHLGMARVLAHEGDIAGAISQLEAVLSLRPRHEAARAQLAALRGQAVR